MPARKRRVFVSFDYDNDEHLKDSFVSQLESLDPPLEIVGWSLKEEPQADWLSKASDAIERADSVVVILGPETYRASGVLKEVGIARELGKKILQIVGYKNRNYLRVSDAGRLFDWDWDILRQLLTPVEEGSTQSTP